MNAIAAGTHSFDHFVRRNVEVDLEANLNNLQKHKNLSIESSNYYENTSYLFPNILQMLASHGIVPITV